MTPEKINLIKSSWSYVITHSEQAGELFYQKLFETAPQLRPMFKGDVKEQSQKLISMVTVVITKLDKLEQILPEVAALAKRHVKYGVNKNHFPVVGGALIWTLEQGLAERWTPQLKAAWVEVYEILSKAMITAMEEELSLAA